MREIEQLVETYLAAERDLVEVVDAVGGTLPLPDGRTVSVGRAEFDARSGFLDARLEECSSRDVQGGRQGIDDRATVRDFAVRCEKGARFREAVAQTLRFTVLFRGCDCAKTTQAADAENFLSIFWEREIKTVVERKRHSRMGSQMPSISCGRTNSPRRRKSTDSILRWVKLCLSSQDLLGPPKRTIPALKSLKRPRKK